MRKVVKHGTIYNLAPEPEEQAAAQARSSHSVDAQMLSVGSPDLEALVKIVLHLIQRLGALEKSR